MTVARLELVLYADHNQFYVADEAASGDGELWDGAALEERLDARRGFLGVLTATYGFVRLIVERLDAPPAAGLEAFDHVVEAPFVARSGRLSVHETTAALAVPPGTYRARVSWSGVAGAAEVDPEPGDPAETILIQLWPGSGGERTVLKWHPEWKPADERPGNPHGLRVLVGRECDLEGLRVVGDPKDADEYDDRSLVRDADGAYWLSFYSREPPYAEVLLELPESELERFHLRPQPPALALDDEHVRATVELEPADRYRYFVDSVLRSGWLWTLADDMSPVEWQDGDGREYALAWPHPRFAELYAEQEAPGSRPEDWELNVWLDALDPDSFVVVFPTSVLDEGRVVPARVLAGDLRRPRP